MDKQCWCEIFLWDIFRCLPTQTTHSPISFSISTLNPYFPHQNWTSNLSFKTMSEIVQLTAGNLSYWITSIHQEPVLFQFPPFNITIKFSFMPRQGGTCVLKWCEEERATHSGNILLHTYFWRWFYGRFSSYRNQDESHTKLKSIFRKEKIRILY